MFVPLFSNPLCVQKHHALHEAAARNSDKAAAMCELLLKSGANVNAQKTNGMTPLRLSAWKGDLESCKVLIAAGFGEKNFFFFFVIFCC